MDLNFRTDKCLPGAARRINETPVSKTLCGSFTEVGFGCRVEAMGSEVFHNRSFGKACPIAPATYDWFGDRDVGATAGPARDSWAAPSAPPAPAA